MVGTNEERRERVALLKSMDALVGRMETSALPGAVRSLLDSDLTLQQLKVLTVLVTATDGASVHDLARSFGVAMSSMSTMVDRLEAQGAVRRDLDPGDHRVRRVHATTQGREVVQKLVGSRPEFAAGVLGLLRLEDLRALEQGMRALTAALAAAGDPGGPPAGPTRDRDVSGA